MVRFGRILVRLSLAGGLAGRLLLPLFMVVAGADSSAETLSDAQIQSAIDRGASTTNKALWKELRKLKTTLITRGEFGAPVELRVTILTDS